MLCPWWQRRGSCKLKTRRGAVSPGALIQRTEASAPSSFAGGSRYFPRKAVKLQGAVTFDEGFGRECSHSSIAGDKSPVSSGETGFPSRWLSFE